MVIFERSAQRYIREFELIASYDIPKRILRSGVECASVGVQVLFRKLALTVVVGRWRRRTEGECGGMWVTRATLTPPSSPS